MAASTTQSALYTAHALLCTSATTSPTSGFLPRKVRPSWICCLAHLRASHAEVSSLPYRSINGIPIAGPLVEGSFQQACISVNSTQACTAQISTRSLPTCWGCCALSICVGRNHLRESRRELGRLRWNMCRCCDHSRIKSEKTHLNLEFHLEQRGKRIRQLKQRCCTWTRREAPCAMEERAPCTELKFMQIHLTVSSALHALIACTEACVDMQHFRQNNGGLKGLVRTASFKHFPCRQAR